MISIYVLIITVLTISGIASFLAILMVIADATIANYGEIKVKINDDRDITVKGGQPLLGSLMQEKIFIPSACGGRGSCGLCKLKVKKGIGDYLPTELPWISDEEKNDNIRLACQIKPKKDIQIQIPESLFNVREYQTEVISIRDLTHDIKEVRLKLLNPGEIKFKAGQFIQFQTPEYELSQESVYRAYSIASVPSDNNMIELEIRLVPNGICTTYVHKYLKSGDKITINGPYGEFYLRDSEREIIFIAGGSGNAPIKSIIYDMAEKKINRKAAYFFGARSKRDLFLIDEISNKQKELPNFKYIPALSSPEPSDNWSGESGLITDVVKKYIKDGKDMEAYLCGSPGMIEACIKCLTELGVSEDMIFYDKF